jgi:cupin 2 domain-containing protein
MSSRLVWRFKARIILCCESGMRISEPKPHQINKLLVSFDSEVRKRGCRTMMRTLESEHWSARLTSETRTVINIFDEVPAHAAAEVFTTLLSRDGVRIERIVSTGQATPADKPHRQGHDEWVLLLAGAAGLRIEGEGERRLRPGDHVLIAAHRAHWVTWTARDEPTIWLAIHFA